MGSTCAVVSSVNLAWWMCSGVAYTFIGIFLPVRGLTQEVSWDLFTQSKSGLLCREAGRGAYLKSPFAHATRYVLIFGVVSNVISIQPLPVPELAIPGSSSVPDTAPSDGLLDTTEVFASETVSVREIMVMSNVASGKV